MIADIWSIAENIESPSTLPQKTLLIVGERKSGKSSIMQNFMLQSSEESPKATVALEYRFIRSTSDNVAHLYELGGGRLLANLINFPITSDSVSTLVVVITLDLSIPYKVLDSLLYWLQAVRARIDEVSEKRSKKNIARAKIMVIGSKYDVFANQESENRKWMGRVLRFFCLKHKASLFYYSLNDNRLTSAVRQTFSHYLFEENSRSFDQREHSSAIQISENIDSFEAIGPPPGGKNSENPEEEWKKAFIKTFPRPSKKK
jgi:GTPase SAR1 family protein